jgi:hypothetical protein
MIWCWFYITESSCFLVTYQEHCFGNQFGFAVLFHYFIFCLIGRFCCNHNYYNKIIFTIKVIIVINNNHSLLITILLARSLIPSCIWSDHVFVSLMVPVFPRREDCEPYLGCFILMKFDRSYFFNSCYSTGIEWKVAR